MLRVRAGLLAAMRQFFDSRGYWEVDTPLLSHDIVVDANLDPYVVPGGAGRPDLFLQTSPEFAMKRLVAAGADAIYQIGHVFRRDERGRLHNPEFTMIEWYRTGDTHHAQMGVVEDLVRAACHSAELLARQFGIAVPSPLQLTKSPFPRISYRDAFQRQLDVDPLAASSAQLTQIALARQVSVPPGLEADDRDGWLNLLLAELIEPQLGANAPEFLCDYPASQSALARIHAGPPPVAERFELYVRGIELCNGYHELTDPAELRARMREQAAIRARERLRPLPADNRLLQAMGHGLPACAGVALGFDRLMLLALGCETVDQVLPFAFDRA